MSFLRPKVYVMDELLKRTRVFNENLDLTSLIPKLGTVENMLSRDGSILSSK